MVTAFFKEREGKANQFYLCIITMSFRLAKLLRKIIMKEIIRV